MPATRSRQQRREQSDGRRALPLSLAQNFACEQIDDIDRQRADDRRWQQRRERRWPKDIHERLLNRHEWAMQSLRISEHQFEVAANLFQRANLCAARWKRSK